MDVSGEVADLMVKESMQITGESVKLVRIWRHFYGRWHRTARNCRDRPI